ncbi:hypothetical protein BKI52_32820 [marine bacterium AO1-C]|nr:hypothetical protein BKI52_32820 [marine bacterium AO1-C]
MPILNYTTTIDAEKTLAQIRKILVNQGATKIVTDYKDKIPVSVTFAIELNNQLIPYSLPANYQGVLSTLKKDKKVQNKYKSEEQAVRIAWRIIKDWIEAQMAIVQSELAELQEVFLPYMVTKRGNTLYKEFKENKTLLLGE